VEDIVKEATTSEERMGKLKSKTKKEVDIITGVTKKAEKKLFKGIKDKLGAIGDFF